MKTKKLLLKITLGQLIQLRELGYLSEKGCEMKQELKECPFHKSKEEKKNPHFPRWS